MRLLVSTLCALAIVPVADGFTVAGERWPGPTVRVWNTTGYKVPVNDAMRAWNAAGANIRFVRAKLPETADLVIRTRSVGSQGESTVGYSGGKGSMLLPRGLGRVVATALAAHELGHVLGLGHESRSCSVMAPVVRVGTASRCGIGACKVVRRCLLQSDDGKGVRTIYGRSTPA